MRAGTGFRAIGWMLLAAGSVRFADRRVRKRLGDKGSAR